MKFGDKIYYETENDEVMSFKESKITIDENYKYVHTNPFYKFASFFTYRFLATPYAFITFKLIKKVKFHNAKVLKQYKKGGYFIYANHTNQFCDGFCPALICFPKKPHVIVNPANVSIPFVGKLTRMWGALPLPNNLEATKNFYHAIEHMLNHNNPIVIYPEAHLWPYYTKIRNFPATAFRYPVKYNKPSFTFTTVYKKRKIGKKPKIEIYVDGPFYPNPNVTDKEAKQQLRDEVYSQLNKRASLSNYEFVNYIKKEHL
ncbi:MAG: 1-acyl-sn-glycerol-3-phosphate acyltransferase [Clostridia bacterium]|nr:1-acyl-sn-glycerol-3-phosphate acyltransferase [Clostridia bacterium]